MGSQEVSCRGVIFFTGPAQCYLLEVLEKDVSFCLVSSEKACEVVQCGVLFFDILLVAIIETEVVAIPMALIEVIGHS